MAAEEQAEASDWKAAGLGGASLAGNAGSGQQGAASSAYRNSPAWGAAPSLRLYLVGYDPADPEPVRQALVSRGSVIVSYIPDDTWLVAAAPRAVRQAVAATGAQAVSPGAVQLGSCCAGGAGGEGRLPHE